MIGTRCHQVATARNRTNCRSSVAPRAPRSNCRPIVKWEDRQMSERLSFSGSAFWNSTRKCRTSLTAAAKIYLQKTHEKHTGDTGGRHEIDRSNRGADGALHCDGVVVRGREAAIWFRRADRTATLRDQVPLDVDLVQAPVLQHKTS